MATTIPFEARFTNVRRFTETRVNDRTKKETEVSVIQRDDDNVCRWCGTTGLVVIATRADGQEEHGPCPYCQLGHVCEFPALHGLPGRPMWREGFWQGRDPVDLVPLYSENNPKPLPRGETVARMRALAQQMGAIVKEV